MPTEVPDGLRLLVPIALEEREDPAAPDDLTVAEDWLLEPMVPAAGAVGPFVLLLGAGEESEDANGEAEDDGELLELGALGWCLIWWNL